MPAYGLLLLLIAWSASIPTRLATTIAQTPAAQAPATSAAQPSAIVSPQVLPDNRVTFRLRAPKASQVTLTGDFWLQQKRSEKLSEDASGVWSFTTEPLAPNYYSYSFSVDGVQMPDPANGLTKPGIGTTESAFWVPGPQAGLLEARPVPHGEVREIYYPASALGKQRRMHIYLPPGYGDGATRYPVLYLFHGSGDDDWAWETVGRVNFILDNLIAQGKAKPMIVVMPSLWALDPPVPSDHASENAALFQKTLFADIVPYVESHYRVLAGPQNRAVGGLGLGRDYLPQFVWPNLDKFSSVLFVSGGADPEHFAAFQKQYPGMLDDPANIKRVRFFLGDGSNDASFPSAKNLAEELKRRGYHTIFFESDQTHGWPEFRLNFEQFAQTAFK